MFANVPEEIRVFTRWAHEHINQVLKGNLRGCPPAPACRWRCCGALLSLGGWANQPGEGVSTSRQN